MDLTFLQPLYDVPGPVASLYFNASRDAEDANHAIQVRWSKARDELLAQGADEATVDAMGEVVGRTEGIPGPHGQVVFGAEGEVLMDNAVSEPPQDQWNRFGPLADPVPFLLAEGRHVPHVLVVADSIGADLRAEFADGRTVSLRVEGADHPVHKVREGGYHHAQMQRSVEEQVGHNADRISEVAAELASRSRADIIAVAGEVQVRGLVQERIPHRFEGMVVDVASGSRAAGSESSLLGEEVLQHLDEYSREQTQEIVATYDRERGNNGRSTEGFAEVVRALQRSQVETILWSDEFAGRDREVWIGPSGEQIALSEQELKDMDVQEPVKELAGPALVRAAATTGAALTPLYRQGEEVDLAEGIGAVLRFAGPG